MTLKENWNNNLVQKRVFDLNLTRLPKVFKVRLKASPRGHGVMDKAVACGGNNASVLGSIPAASK